MQCSLTGLAAQLPDCTRKEDPQATESTAATSIRFGLHESQVLLHVWSRALVGLPVQQS